ncbi:MAG: DNA primase [Methanosphaera sp.]|nr:DNA primase [Methanosphaera sp.]
MVNEEVTTTKYLIHAQINAQGFVEKSDVVGAIFGQTEGLLTDSLDLRELQKTGRIGRIQVDMNNNSGRTKGEVIIPSSLDRIETTILAASLETINRVGPCEANLRVIKIDDVRAVKRQTIVERATELYHQMMKDFTPENSRMIEEVKESIRIPEIIEYGDDNLPAGPNTPTSDAIVIVEGRSDVLNLLKYGIKNTIAVEGVNIPKTVIDLTKDRTVTAFLDGDRGGDLILKELLQVGQIDYVTRAPRGQEVEYLDKDQVIYALKNKTSIDKITDQANYNHNHHRYHNKPKKHDADSYIYHNSHKYNDNSNKYNEHKNKSSQDNNNHNDKHNKKHNYKHFNTPKNSNTPKTEKKDYGHDNSIKHDNILKTDKPKVEQTSKPVNDDLTNDKSQTDNSIDKKSEPKEETKPKNKYLKVLDELSGTSKGKLYDSEFNLIKEVPVETIFNEVKAMDENIKTVIFDGIISQRLVDLSKEKNIEKLVAVRMNEVVKKPETIKIMTK